MAGWIKMPLGMEVGDFVSDKDPAPPKKGGTDPQIFRRCLLWPNGWMVKMPIDEEVGLSLGDIVLDGDPAPPKRGTASQFSAHVYCGQTAGLIKTPLGRE